MSIQLREDLAASNFSAFEHAGPSYSGILAYNHGLKKKPTVRVSAMQAEKNRKAFLDKLDSLTTSGGQNLYGNVCQATKAAREAMLRIVTERPDLIHGSVLHPESCGGLTLGVFRDGKEFSIDTSGTGGVDIMEYEDEPYKVRVILSLKKLGAQFYEHIGEIINPTPEVLDGAY